jgi:hypothetical protein
VIDNNSERKNYKTKKMNSGFSRNKKLNKKKKNNQMIYINIICKLFIECRKKGLKDAKTRNKHCNYEMSGFVSMI